jgi:hypothetical protein
MLTSFVSDFASALMSADAKRPIAVSATTQRSYQAGIGPHTETATLRLIQNELAAMNPGLYGRIETDIPYPNAPRQKCDWRWSTPSGEVFDIEAKMMRLMGDNAKPNDNILTHILSPYPQQRSALTDCQKLLGSGFPGYPVILIYGYEYEGYPLEPVIDAFEYIAAKAVRLSDRHTASFRMLIHPVHQAGAVYAWTISAKP